MVIFGGQPDYTVYGNNDLNDVWALSLAGDMSWNQLSPSGTPPAPTTGMGAVYDPARDRMLITGGGSGVDYPSTGGQTWSLDFATTQWQELLTTGAPATGSPAVYDAANDRVITFPPARELSLSPAPAWRGLGPPNRGTSLVYDAALTWDAPRARALVSGGGDPYVDYGGAADNTFIYAYGVRDSFWSNVDYRVPLPPRPPARIDHSALIDATRGTLIEFGGYSDAGPPKNDVWSMTLTGTATWTHVIPAGTPPAGRGGHAAIVDSVGDRMLVFGGADKTQDMNDLWALSLGSPQWTPLSPAGTPPSPRQNAAAVYDPIGQRMLLFGGFPGPLNPLLHLGPAYNDLWALSLTGPLTWTQLSPLGAPPPPAHDPIALYDPDRSRIEVLTDAGVWALELGDPPSWQQLDVANAVIDGIERGAAVYDDLNRRVLLLPMDSSSLWELRFAGSPTGVPIPATAIQLSLRGALPNPAVGPVAIAFALPGSGPARLALYDLAGREVAAQDVGSLGAGSHVVELAPRGALRAGVYFARLSAGGRALTARVAVVR